MRFSRSFPFSENKISPFLLMAAGDGRSCNIDNEVMVLPEPDSPTIATISLCFISKEMSLTAETCPCPVRKSTLRFFI